MSLPAIQHERAVDVAELIARESEAAGGIVTNPLAVARRLYMTLPPPARAEALIQALAWILSHRVSTRAVDDHEAELDRRAAERGQANPSWKVGMIRAEWQRRLEGTLVVGARNVRLADCTAEQLRYAAGRYVDLAKTNQERAAKIILWAEAVEMEGVARFGELPEERLKALLGGAS